jgi:SOS-response transcriptional repressor LexA
MATRPTKKQKELLEFIEAFIAEHGYSPSYREIMNGVGYTSVATVSLHINNLVKRGHLIKRDNAARSLEPTKATTETPTAAIQEHDSKWLFTHIEERFKKAEETFEQGIVDEIYVLIGAIKVLGFKDQAVAYIVRLRALESTAS